MVYHNSEEFKKEQFLKTLELFNGHLYVDGNYNTKTSPSYIETLKTSISSQAQQECWEGPETRVYDLSLLPSLQLEKIMKLHERLEEIKATCNICRSLLLWYSPTLQRNSEKRG